VVGSSACAERESAMSPIELHQVSNVEIYTAISLHDPSVADGEPTI
jgi:hypothetical protein